MSPLFRRRDRPAGAPATSDGTYEELPYPGSAFPQTHPDRLATPARLCGGRPAPVDGCRLLELGCGDGGNLLPLAYALPHSTFVGVDLSGRAIARARETADRLGLQNVELQQADILELDRPALGRFDHVVAHGVFSWVPDPVRDALLAAVAACLERDGVAFVSFNALPGGHVRQLLRGVLRWHVRDITAPQERLAAARDALAILANEPAYGGDLAGEVARLRERSDAGLFHDDLADVNDAFHLHEVLERAGAHGLRFLGEAAPRDAADAATPRTREVLDRLAGDRVAREQYHDILGVRSFRQVLLCRDDARMGPEPDPAALGDLLVASALRPRGAARGGRQEFRRDEGGALTTDHRLVQAALTRLATAWPRPLPFAELAGDASPGDAAALGAAVLRAYLGGLVELHLWAPDLPDTPGDRPRASAFARLQASQGSEVTTLRHETVRLADERSRRLLLLADGTRDRAALADELGLGEHGLDVVREQLERLSALALLETPGVRSSR